MKPTSGLLALRDSLGGGMEPAITSAAGPDRLDLLGKPGQAVEQDRQEIDRFDLIDGAEDDLFLFLGEENQRRIETAN